MKLPDSKAFLLALIRQKTLILGTILLVSMFSMVSFKYVARRYKVQTTISIQTQYFQVPLIRDFLPETFDGGELRSQREGLLRRALDHKYLLELGKRHHLFGKLKDEEITSFELDDLSKRFEIVPAGPTSFLISFYSTTPEAGYNVIQDVLGHIRLSLSTERHTTLLRLHDAIEERLESLSFGGKTDSAMLAARPDLVKREIDRVEEQIRVLKATYSEKHPKVAELNKKLEALLKFIDKKPEQTNSKSRENSFSVAKVDPGSRELFLDLLKKYHYLEVAIYLDEQNQDTYLSVLQEPFVPKAPMWPKRSIFLIWGIVTGFLIGSVLALLRELLPVHRRKIAFFFNPTKA